MITIRAAELRVGDSILELDDEFGGEQMESYGFGAGVPVTAVYPTRDGGAAVSVGLAFADGTADQMLPGWIVTVDRPATSDASLLLRMARR